MTDSPTTITSMSLNRAVEIAQTLLVKLEKLPALPNINFNTPEKAFLSSKRIQLHYAQFNSILEHSLVGEIESLAGFLDDVGLEIALGELEFVTLPEEKDFDKKVNKLLDNLGMSVEYSLLDSFKCKTLHDLFRCDKIIGKIHFMNSTEPVDVNTIVSWFDLLVVSNEHITKTRDYHIYFESLFEENGKMYVFLGS